jgi:hypothetical protein
VIKPIRCSQCRTVFQRRELLLTIENGKTFTCPNSNCLRKLTSDQIEEFLVEMGEITYRKPTVEGEA